MSTDSIALINFALHSLILGSAGWGVACLLRDPLHRSMAAGVALVFCVVGPLTISQWPYPYIGKVPLLTAVHETLETDWRINVPATESVPAAKTTKASIAASPAPRPAWSIDDFVHASRYLFWTGLITLLLRHFWRTARVLRWSRTLRRPNEMEVSALPPGMETGRLRAFDSEGSPCAVGWLRPVIAVPASSFQTLTATEWRWLMGHEQEHLRLGDTMHSWIQECLRAFLWWHPFAHLLIECHARAREEVCDAAALRHSQGREHREYADFLLMWAAQPQFHTSCVTHMAHSLPARRLKARLVALMQARGVRQRVGAAFCLGCAALVLLLPMVAASFGIARASSTEAASTTPVKSEDLKRPPSVLFTLRVIRAHQFLRDEGILQPPELAKLLVETTNMKEADLLASPNVATHLRRTEVMGIHTLKPGSPNELAGVRATVRAAGVKDGKAVVETTLELGVEEGPMKPGAPAAGDIHWERMKQYRKTATVELATNHGLVMHFKSGERPITAILVARALDSYLGPLDQFTDHEVAPAGDKVRLTVRGSLYESVNEIRRQSEELNQAVAQLKAAQKGDVPPQLKTFQAHVQKTLDRRLASRREPPSQIVSFDEPAVFETRLGKWRLTPVLRKSDGAVMIRLEALHEKEPEAQVQFSTQGSKTYFLTGLGTDQDLAGKSLLHLYQDKPLDDVGERINVRIERVAKFNE